MARRDQGVLLPEGAPSAPPAKRKYSQHVHASLAPVRIRSPEPLWRSRCQFNYCPPSGSAVEGFANSGPSPQRAKEDCRDIGAGAACDRAAEEIDRTNQGNEKGASPTALLARPQRRIPEANGSWTRAGDLAGGPFAGLFSGSDWDSQR